MECGNAQSEECQVPKPKEQQNEGVTKVNVLEQFCRKNGLQELKENWRKNVETEIEFKEKELEELTNKKKLAKSKKRKLEMFKECRIKLNSLIVDWKETPGKDEELKYGMLKENIERERMLREDSHKKTTGRQLLRKLTVYVQVYV